MTNKEKYQVIVYKEGFHFGKSFKRQYAKVFTTARTPQEAKRNIRWRLGIDQGRHHIVADDYYEYTLEVHKMSELALTA